MLSRLEELKRYHLNRLTYEVELKLRLREVDLASLIRLSVASIPEEKVQIVGKCNLYLGDEDLLSRIFENLALNAKHAIEGGGNLIISLSEDEEGRVRISFTNIGPQIPPENLDRIFDFGFTTRTDGYGIGLTVVKDLIDLHNGRIQVRSTPQETAFDIFLSK
jgi:signal transduction histidine kinase